MVELEESIGLVEELFSAAYRKGTSSTGAPEGALDVQALRESLNVWRARLPSPGEGFETWVSVLGWRLQLLGLLGRMCSRMASSTAGQAAAATTQTALLVSNPAH